MSRPLFASADKTYRPPRGFPRVRAFFRRNRALFVITLLALIVRLVWNLAFHNPLDFAYSDMGGYLGRANEMLDRPEPSL